MQDGEQEIFNPDRGAHNQAELLTSTETAAILGITPTYLCRLKRMGMISSVGRHKRVRYRRSEIEAFQEHQRPPALLTTTEAASLLGLTPGYLRQLKQAGKIAPVEQQPGQGREDLYRRSDLAALPLGHQHPLLSGFRDTPAFRERIGFRDALKQAIERSGLTLQDAADTSRLNVNVIYGWIAGRWKPFRDDLERLAETVHEPQLVDLIESRWRTITARCRECGKSRQFSTGRIRSYADNNDGSNYSVDWEKGEAEHTCKRCKLLEPQRRIIKRKGRKGLRDMARPLVKWGQENPEERLSHARQARAALRSGPLSERALRRLRLGRLSLKPAGTFSLCVVCHRLIFTAEAVHHSRQRQGVQLIGKFHRSCLGEWKRSTTYRSWWANRLQARKTGQSATPMPLPPRPPHRPVTTAALAEAYETTLRYFWLREGSRRADRDETGDVRSVAWLLDKLSLTHQGLHQRIDRFLSLLPDERTATGSTQVWREVLLPLNIAESTG